MAIIRFTVSRDDKIYEAWPDLALTEKGKLICLFTECTHHLDRSNSRIVLCESIDRGRTWAPKRYLTDISQASEYWNCARITRLCDNTLIIVCDKIRGDERNNDSRLYIWKASSEGECWQGPYETPNNGIVPDKLLELKDGRWILSSHLYNRETSKLEQQLFYSDDQGRSWSSRIIVASNTAYNLCETSILELSNGILVAFLRENSGQGLDCFKAISHDRGETWEGVYNMPLPGCHRPVSGILKSGKIFITYRFAHGGTKRFGNWTQNLFAALTDEKSVSAIKREDQTIRIIPIDYDRNPVSDIGYSGWVQFDDGEIYIVNYIMDDSPNSQIRGYSMTESDILFNP